LQLERIYAHLPDKLQSLFKEMPIHSKILPEITRLNEQFIPVMNYVATYKPELGYLFQRLVESYNMIFIGQFEAYY
jgi:hypothetical protein